MFEIVVTLNTRRAYGPRWLAFLCFLFFPFHPAFLKSSRLKPCHLLLTVIASSSVTLIYFMDVLAARLPCPPFDTVAQAPDPASIRALFLPIRKIPENS